MKKHTNKTKTATAGLFNIISISPPARKIPILLDFSNSPYLFLFVLFVCIKYYFIELLSLESNF